MHAHVVKRLEINDEAGIQMKKNFKAIVVKTRDYKNVSFGEECRNYIDKAWQLHIGVEVLKLYVTTSKKSKKKKEFGFFYMIDMDHELRLKNMFGHTPKVERHMNYFGMSLHLT